MWLSLNKCPCFSHLPCLSHSKTHKLIKAWFVSTRVWGFKSKRCFYSTHKLRDGLMGCGWVWNWGKPTKRVKGKERVEYKPQTHLFMVHSLPSIYSPCWPLALVFFFSISLQKLLPLGWSSSLGGGGRWESNIFHWFVKSCVELFELPMLESKSILRDFYYYLPLRL